MELDDALGPGEEGGGWLRLGVPRFWEDVIMVGDVLEGGEGSRVIASAAVSEVLTVGHVNERLAARVRRDFPEPGSAPEILRLLAEASDTERVQAAIVFTASGNIERLRAELALAKIDWRDVLVNGGLANDGWPAILDQELGPDAG